MGNQLPIIDRVDGGQTRAKNISEENFRTEKNFPPKDAEDGLDNDKEEMNGSEERGGHLADNVEENENGTTDLLPILTLVVEEEEERNETGGENSVPPTGSSVSFDVGGSGAEPTGGERQ